MLKNRLRYEDGSSPLTRGKRAGVERAGHVLRLIPAHAGKTRARRFRPHCGPAHPRSRGENPSSSSIRFFKPGSSPLTRGKPGTRCQRGTEARLIPAHAGKTRIGCVSHFGFSAHPRSRGENLDENGKPRKKRGSSPLTRGKRLAHVQRYADNRLIPAHAGKTMRRQRRRGKSRAHPRSRGENVVPKIKAAAAVGSSPLTRGKLWDSLATPSDQRLIPAHAGKTAGTGSARTR